MVFSKTGMTGLDYAFPDTCNTPAGPAVTPVAYPNTGDPALAAPTQSVVYNACMPAHTLSTTIPVSSGDAAGTLGGAASATFMGACWHTTSSAVVWYGTSPATRMLDATAQNNGNAVGSALAPSQTQVMILR